jgi:hypothetical protein
MAPFLRHPDYTQERPMKYLLAWMVGVPGTLIVLWMLFNAFR